MDALYFLLRFNLVFILLVFVYGLLISNTVYHQVKRAYLVTAPLVSGAVALLAAAEWNSVQLITIELPILTITHGDNLEPSSSLSWAMILMCIWFLGILIQLLRFIIQLYWVRSYMKNEVLAGSCTFLRKIRIDPGLDKDAKEKVSIHEQVHADELHSMDLLWYSLLTIIFWFNPFFSVARSAIKEVHEYIADAQTDAKTENYSNTILATAFGLSRMPIVNEFNSINIKHRITMLKKTKTRAQRNRLIAAIATVVIIATSVAFTTISDNIEKGKVYEKVDQMPRFKGCENKGIEGEPLDKCALNELYAFMGANVHYPKAAEKEGVEGMALIGFILDATGAVTEAKVEKSVDSRLDAEALRVVESMPDWTPGVHEGKKVSVSMALPIMFKLSD